MKKIEEKDRKTYNMVAGYLKEGGSPFSPFVAKFCQQYDINLDEFAKVMSSPEADTIEARMKKLGLI